MTNPGPGLPRRVRRKLGVKAVPMPPPQTRRVLDQDRDMLSVAARTALKEVHSLAAVAQVANAVNGWTEQARRLLVNCVIQGIQTDFRLNDLNGELEAVQYRIYTTLVPQAPVQDHVIDQGTGRIERRGHGLWTPGARNG